MKKQIFTGMCLGAALFANGQIIEINGNFADKAKGWQALSKNSILTSYPDGCMELKKPESASYADVGYSKVFVVNADETATITIIAKGNGLLKAGFRIEGVGNYIQSALLKEEFSTYTFTLDLKKYAKQLPAKATVKFILSHGNRLIIKSITLKLQKNTR